VADVCAHTTPRSWTLPLHITAPLSMNGREHWRVKAKKVRDVRNHAALVAAASDIPELTGFTVELHYAPRDKRRRDPENLIATLKPFVDGLIDAGVAPDDCPPYYSTTVPVIDPPNGKDGRLYAIVRELLPDADEAAHEQSDVVDDGRDDDPWVA
jgi:crossover junction endodeoxyribonuclease RusA